MKIGLFGGSFNPVHYAHLGIIEKILSKKIVDQVWIMPCKDHAFDKSLAPIDNRLDMLELALSEMPSCKNSSSIKIDLTELDMSGRSYTSDTLRLLNKKYNKKIYSPDDQRRIPENNIPEKYKFSFICGADILSELDRWHESEYIRKNLSFIVVKRPDHIISPDLTDDILLEAIVENDSDISSSKIRERVASKKSLEGLVTKKVEEYINDHRLYSCMTEHINPAATVDLIVPTKDGMVFIKRKHPPFKGKWAFPGGYINTGEETLEEAGVRELFEETSLVAEPSDLKLINVYSEPGRDPRGHVISHAYLVTRFSGKLNAKDDADDIALFMTKPEELAFDHSRIYDDAIKYIKKYG